MIHYQSISYISIFRKTCDDKNEIKTVPKLSVLKWNNQNQNQRPKMKTSHKYDDKNEFSLKFNY